MIVAYHGYASVYDYLVTVEIDNRPTDDDSNVSTLPHGEKPLPHHVLHSPDGFCWGYGGSGPAELARCLLLHFTGQDDVSPWLYQKFKDDVIARLPQNRDWTLTFDQVRDWFNKQVA